ncbi:MAG: LamG domain-containing protein, partial [Myxococcales bacterium]
EPLWSNGRLAGGLTFNAATQFVQLPADVLKTLEAVTVMAWVKLSANPAGATLFDFGSSPTNHFYLRTNSGNATNPGLSYGAQVGGNTALEVLTTYSLPTSVWKHVALAVGDGNATLYVDGLPINNKSFNFLPSSLGATVGNWLARTHSNSSNLWGTLDDFRIYDRALNREELESVATPGSDYVHFGFDEPCGTDAFDKSEKKLVAKLPFGGNWINGRVGGALQLNGSSQYVELPAAILQSCSDLSVAMWVQRSTSTPWERLFSIGNGLESMMTLTPATPLNYMRFSARLNADQERDSSAQQMLTSSSALLSPQSGIWSHVAVVIQSGTGRLYFDGKEAASGSITIKPSDLGATSINVLGKPLYLGEAYLAAAIDDLRISCRAFSPAEVKMLAQADP